MFTRTSKAASRIAAQFRAHSVQKQYLVAVEKLGLQGRCKGKIDEIPSEGFSSLHWELKELKDSIAVLRVTISTGRKHQIRRQLVLGGLGPIIGDYKFGFTGTAPLPNEGIMLHASSIQLRYPVGKQQLVRYACDPSWPF